MEKKFPSLEYDRIKNQFRLASSGLAGNIALSFFTVLILRHHLETTGLIYWLGWMNLYNIPRIRIIRKYYKKMEKNEVKNLKYSNNLFFLSVIISALNWVSLMFLPSNIYFLEFMNHIELIYGCAIFAAIAMLSFSLRSSITFSLIIIMSFLYKILIPENMHFHFIGIAIIILGVVTVSICFYLYRIQMGSLLSVLKSQSLMQQRDVIRKQYKKLSENLKKRLETERLIAHGLQDALDFQASILENSLSGIYVIDKNGFFIQSNEVGAKILGYTREELFGKSSSIILFGDSKKIIKHRFKELVKTRNSIKGFESRIRKKDGTIIDILFNASPILKNNTIIGSVCSVEDITNRKRIEVLKKIRMDTLEKLAKGKDLKKILQKILDVFIEINSDLSSCIIFFDKYTGKLKYQVGIGMPPEYIAKVNKMDESHSEFPCVQSILKKKKITLENIPLAKDYRATSNVSGISRFKSSISQPIIDKNQNILGVFEIFSSKPNILSFLDSQILDEFLQLVRLAIERKHIESELLSRNQSLSTLYNISSAVLEEIELKKLFEKIFKALAGIREVEVIERVKIFMNENGRLNLYYDSKENYDPGEKVCTSIGKGECLCGITFNTGEVVISEDSEIDPRHLPYEKYLHHHSHIVVPLIGRDKISGVLCLYTIMNANKISENEKYFFLSTGRQLGLALENASLYEELKALSLNDPLTGLANRHRMKIMVQKLIPMAKRKREPFSVAFLDLDFFKEFNDSHGHAEGDKLLEVVANILKQNVREEDLAVRHGGEEFLLILTNTNLEAAGTVLERIRVEVMKKTKVSISAGLALYDLNSTFEEILDHADKALYEAKKSGKNKVVEWTHKTNLV